MGSSGHGNEILGSRKKGNFLTSEYQLLEETLLHADSYNLNYMFDKEYNKTSTEIPVK